MNWKEFILQNYKESFKLSFKLPDLVKNNTLIFSKLYIQFDKPAFTEKLMESNYYTLYINNELHI